ncbi:hypothetical protein SapgrDRAFT_0895 [Saprospira grandis DSM 2844]|uniref:Lipoprotein n=1 Tax=Saprospira grandis DSM 2844 TaxID=694433 RepID=J0P5D7_9BACT|nr:hypothetical protein [Saprospira grandis]EJF52627.1 hypothetical protein SapgrDRAFT_0895 [Saprospira grandis DSM 2844]
MINKYFFASCMLLLLGLSACKKENISPSNQEDAFVKYYGHVNDQIGKDVKETTDKGFIILGSSNAFVNAASYNDFYLVKTDSLGNEEWSKTFGDGSNGYEETGHRVLVLSDESGYLVAGNRTTVVTVGGQSTLDATYIVLYKLDLEGNVVWEKVLLNGSTLSSSEIYKDFVYDIKELPDGGFVLAGETTDVYIGKPEYQDYQALDKTDVLLMRLDLDGNIIWRSVRGFVGEDRAASVEVLNGAYMVTATAEKRDEQNGTPTNPNFTTDILVIRFRASSGSEVSQQSFGGQDMFLVAGGSCYDSLNARITILSHVENRDPTRNEVNEGDLLLLQVDEGVGEIQRRYLGKTNGGFTNTTEDLLAGSIALVPSEVAGNEPSFVISAVYQYDDANFGDELAMAKVGPNLTPEWDGEIRQFGRASVNNGSQALAGNQAGTVMPIRELVPGTTRRELKGYLMTGTMNVATNAMVCLIKTNNEGLLTPVD